MVCLRRIPNGLDNLSDMEMYLGHIVITSSKSTLETSAPWLTIPNFGYAEDQ
jgi:hypothetical protein